MMMVIAKQVLTVMTCLWMRIIKLKGLLGDVCDIAHIQLERSLSLECADGQNYTRSTSRLKSKDIFDNDYTEAKCT